MRISTGEGRFRNRTCRVFPPAKKAIGIPFRMLHVMYRAQALQGFRMSARNADPAGLQP